MDEGEVGIEESVRTEMDDPPRQGAEQPADDGLLLHMCPSARHHYAIILFEDLAETLQPYVLLAETLCNPRSACLPTERGLVALTAILYRLVLDRSGRWLQPGCTIAAHVEDQPRTTYG